MKIGITLLLLLYFLETISEISFGYVQVFFRRPNSKKWPKIQFLAWGWPKTHIWPKRAKKIFRAKKSTFTICAYLIGITYPKISQIQQQPQALPKCAQICPLFARFAPYTVFSAQFHLKVKSFELPPLSPIICPQQM